MRCRLSFLASSLAAVVSVAPERLTSSGATGQARQPRCQGTRQTRRCGNALCVPASDCRCIKQRRHDQQRVCLTMCFERCHSGLIRPIAPPQKTAAHQLSHKDTLGPSAPMSPLLSLGSGKGLPKLLFQNLPVALRSCAKSYTQENLATVQEVGQRDGKHKSQHMHNEAARALGHRIVE